MNKYTIKQKYFFLSTLIELRIYCGYSIVDLIGKPYSYFDYDKIQISIENLKLEKSQIDN